MLGVNELRTVKFRPLRRIKKTGKVVVASYGSWSRVSTSNYNPFNLIIDPEYRSLPHDEYVYDSDGALLYFFPYDPSDIPVIKSSVARETLGEDWVSKWFAMNGWTRGVDWESGNGIDYSGAGIGCNG